MLRPIDLISTDPGVKWLSIPRLSLDEYNQQARTHISNINEVKQVLQCICLPFSSIGTISNKRCVEAVIMSEKLNSHGAVR
jgi:hypothetical protein